MATSGDQKLAVDNILGPEAPVTLEQEAQRTLALNAAEAALRLHRPDTRHTGWVPRVPTATSNQLNPMRPEL